MSDVSERDRGDRRIIGRNLSLQELDQLCQLRFMEEQCQDLLTNLDAVILNTLGAAPVRVSQPYPLVHSDLDRYENAEHKLERALWLQ